MKKSQGITKYSLEWQLVRMKSKKLSTVEAKINNVLVYLSKHRNKHAYERVANYLEGLQMGYRGKSDAAVELLDDTLKSLTKYDAPVDTDHQDWHLVADVELVAMYKDLTTRSGRWLSKGYSHKEQAAFEDKIVVEMDRRGIPHGHSNHVSKRNKAGSIKNTHKFFF